MDWSERGGTKESVGSPESPCGSGVHRRRTQVCPDELHMYRPDPSSLSGLTGLDEGLGSTDGYRHEPLHLWSSGDEARRRSHLRVPVCCLCRTEATQTDPRVGGPDGNLGDVSDLPLRHTCPVTDFSVHLPEFETEVVGPDFRTPFRDSTKLGFGRLIVSPSVLGVPWDQTCSGGPYVPKFCWVLCDRSPDVLPTKRSTGRPNKSHPTRLSESTSGDRSFGTQQNFETQPPLGDIRGTPGTSVSSRPLGGPEDGSGHAESFWT